MLKIKRVYEASQAGDGYRVLVDRLWPRGVSKQKAAVDVWLKEIAPSPALRSWFGHDPERFSEFRVRYRAELKTNDAVKQLAQLIQKHNTITLLYGAHDQKHNHAVVLLEFLSRKDEASPGRNKQ